jgi:hypothetical protein
MATQRVGQPLDERGEDGPVCPVQAGSRFVRRSTATSCRRTSSSTSLMADVRPSSTSSPSTCWNIKYNSRSNMAEIMPSRGRSSIVAGQRQVQNCGTPQGQCPCGRCLNDDWKELARR